MKLRSDSSGITASPAICRIYCLPVDTMIAQRLIKFSSGLVGNLSRPNTVRLQLKITEILLIVYQL